MTLEPRPSPPRAAAEVRAATVRRTEALPGVLGALLAMLLAVLVMGTFVVLDYRFDQDPHRLVKVGLGVAAIGAIVAVPTFGLLLLPVVTPFLPWVPPAPIPGLNALNVLLFSLFGSFALTRVFQRRPVFRGGRLSTPLGVLLGLCALSIVRGGAFPTGYSYNAADASLQLFRSATTFAPYFVVLAMVGADRDRRRIAWAVLAGLMLESLATIALGRNGSGGRAIGSIGQSNELGSYCAVLAVVAAALLAGTRSRLGQLVLLGEFAAGSFALLLSLSRGAMLAIAAGLAVVAWRTSRVAFGVLVALLLLSPLWAPDYVKDRITGSEIEVEGSDEATLDLSAEARLETWQTILAVVQQHALEGVGFAGLSYVLPDFGSTLGLEEVKDSSHNTFLRMLSEMGILGLATFVWLLWSCWRLAGEGIRRARTAFDRALAVGLSGAVVALAVSCAFGDRFFNVVISSMFWMVCALVETGLPGHPAPEPAAAPAAAPAGASP